MGAVNATPFAYITNGSSDTVSVINIATNTVTDTIAVGRSPMGVATAPNGSKVYVTNGDNTVSVIDTATNTKTATITGFQSPTGLAVTPDGTKVYVANRNVSYVQVIDTSTNAVSPIEVGAAQYGVAVAPDGSKVYIANDSANGVSVITTATNPPTVTSIVLSDNPYGLAVSPDGTKLYVGVRGDRMLPTPSTIQVVNTSDNTVAATVTLGDQPWGLAVSADGTTVYVAAGSSVTKIATSSNTIVTTVAVGSRAMGVSLTPDGTKLYVATETTNPGLVKVIRTSDFTVTDTVNVGSYPMAFGNFIAQSATHTVTYANGGGTGTAPTQAAVSEGASFSVAANTFTRAGYTFTGWNDGATGYAAGASYTMSISNVTLTAQWTSAAVNGACATLAATAFAPSTGLCTSGTASAVANGSPWTWSCTGSGGGSTASCSAPNASTATGSGTGRALVAATNGWVVDAASSGFVATSSLSGSPALPPGYTFPHGLMSLRLTTGTAGSSATVDITYPAALPAGTVYWKYGRTASNNTAHWYQFAGAVISGSTVTLTLTDGADGDDDMTANSVISDPGGPGVPGGGAAAIPTLSQWGQIILAGLMALFGVRQVRRRPLLQ